MLDAFRKAMAELDVSGLIYATDITSASPAFQKADVGILVPTVGDVNYTPTLQNIVTQHNIGLLVPCTDLDLRTLARHRESYAKLGCRVMIGNEDSVMMCRDKARTSAVLQKAGLTPVRTVGMAEFRRDPFYPCFVKPVRGSAGRGAALIQNEEELRTHMALYSDLLVVQEYLPGQEYTIDVYRDRQGIVRCVVPRQRLVVRSGEVEKGVTIKDDVLIESAVRLAGQLGDLWGVFCCQCRRKDGSKPQFFEVNPRFGGGCVLSIAAGANLPRYLLEEVLGLPISATMGQFTNHMLMLRYEEAVFMPVDNVKSLPGFKTPMFR